MDVSPFLHESLSMLASAYRRARTAIIVQRGVSFPDGSVVYVDCPQFHGYGIVRDIPECWPDHIAVQVQSGNTWYYEMERVTKFRVPRSEWPSWILDHKRHQSAMKAAHTRKLNQQQSLEMERR